MGDPAGEEISAALAAARSAIDAVRALYGPDARAQAAGRLAEGLREASEEAARIRHDEALVIWETEKLSLAQLSRRLGISKARADQIIRAARSKDTDGSRREDTPDPG